MKFERDVYSNNEFANTPDVMIVDIDLTLANRIRQLAQAIKELGARRIMAFDSSPDWYLYAEDDWGKEIRGERACVDLVTLGIAAEDCWWEANLKNSDVKFYSGRIMIKDLPT